VPRAQAQRASHHVRRDGATAVTDGGSRDVSKEMDMEIVRRALAGLGAAEVTMLIVLLALALAAIALFARPDVASRVLGLPTGTGGPARPPDRTPGHVGTP
jgi:hypothetical protein